MIIHRAIAIHQESARRLYGHIDNLELYTGLVAEETMPLAGGLRFACGYTVCAAPPNLICACLYLCTDDEGRPW